MVLDCDGAAGASMSLSRRNGSWLSDLHTKRLIISFHNFILLICAYQTVTSPASNAVSPLTNPTQSANGSVPLMLFLHAIDNLVLGIKTHLTWFRLLSNLMQTSILLISLRNTAFFLNDSPFQLIRILMYMFHLDMM